MSDDSSDKNPLNKISSLWRKIREPALFKPDEVEIIVNRVLKECFIFHTPPLPINIDYIEYDHAKKRLHFHSEQGKRYDLGVKIQSLVRPVIEQSDKIAVAQMHEGMPISWFSAPVRHVNQEE
jgi:hypothetical protein